MYGGLRSILAIWPVLLVAATSGALAQFATANYLSYQLTDIVSSLVSLSVTVAFLKVWAPAHDPAHAVARSPGNIESAHGRIPPWQGWIPWLIVAAVVAAWTICKVATFHQKNLPWAGLHNAVFITLYNKPYAAVFNFQPLATGTAILVSSILTALAGGVGVKGYLGAVVTTWKQIRLPSVTVTAIVGLAFLMNYSGIAYTLGLASRPPAHYSRCCRPSSLARRVSVGERFLGQRTVRKSAGRRCTAAAPQSHPHRCHQFFRWRAGEDDFTAKYRHRVRDHRTQRPRRRDIFANVRPQHRSHDIARLPCLAAAIRMAMDDCRLAANSMTRLSRVGMDPRMAGRGGGMNNSISRRGLLTRIVQISIAGHSRRAPPPPTVPASI